MGDVTLVLVDTNVLLEDPAVLGRIRKRGGLPFLTSTILDELDFNKDLNKRANKATNQADASRASKIARNAQLIFREFSVASSSLTELPTGKPLREGDNLTRVSFEGGPVFIVGRDEFRSRSNNDARIIELAKDYKMFLITRDKGMKVRADTLGVNVELWTGPEKPRHLRNAPNGRRRGQHSYGYLPHSGASTSGQKPFAICISPINETDAPLRVSKIPEAGDPVKLANGHEFRLGTLISAGGEGSIYETQLVGHVCKIYHRNRLTNLKKRKIELMVSRRIDRAGICWPTEVVTDRVGEFVGYLMPRAEGTPIQKAMFVKPVLEKMFPSWKRRDLVNVAGTFLDHIDYLHNLNIIVGDINPLNLMVTEDSTRLWIVDTDSFQIENFPCPVGTVNFTPPEIQGRNYAEFLRTKNHELFAVATMIFMILFPGKPPYAQQGGGTPADNIKSKNFPYPFKPESLKSPQPVMPTSAPQGTWQFIWGNLPYRVRQAFFAAFCEDRRASIKEWTALLIDYRNQLVQGSHSEELFPLQFKIRNPISVNCAECSVSFQSSQPRVEKLCAEKKPLWCPECAHQFRLKLLAAKSQRETVRITGQPTVSSSASSNAYSNQFRRTSAKAPSRQRPSTSQGSAQTHQTSLTNPPTDSSDGIWRAILRFLFK